MHFTGYESHVGRQFKRVGLLEGQNTTQQYKYKEQLKVYVGGPTEQERSNSE